MNIREILIYSHKGEMRRIQLRVNGLNIVTGRSSTGKSALSEIVEYCMGRSTFNVPEGPIRDKVAWYAVIFQFAGEQVLVAKPAPAANAASCSRAMILRGATVEAPPFDNLAQNADDNTVVDLLSGLVGLGSLRTEVPTEQSRSSFVATIKHTYYYLFQKQGLIANKEQLFYRQNEPHIPQTIKDTLPILLGVIPDDRLETDIKLRAARRELKIAQKQLSEARQFSEELNFRASGLISEAKEVGIVARDAETSTTAEAILMLAEISLWKPAPIPDEDSHRIATLEDEISELRKERSSLNESLRATKWFAEREDGFTDEAREQRSRLDSVHALPSNPESGEWQWPFIPEGFGLDTPIGQALTQEIASLDRELQAVVGERPQLDEYISGLDEKIAGLTRELNVKSENLASAISANAAIAEMGSRNTAAAKTVGRISLFLETYRPDEDILALQKTVDERQRIVSQLEADTGVDDSAERLKSILNIISNRIGRYVRELEAEFSEFPVRLDLNHLTIVIDRPDRPVPMTKTGGGANHLAYHLGALLALHHFAATNGSSIPSFLFLDQPTQVYFPSEQVYLESEGSVEATERDSDLDKVRKLFAMLHRFATEEAPNFQIIVTEHANLRDDWFQQAIVETPWTKPPALVPEEWEPFE